MSDTTSDTTKADLQTRLDEINSEIEQLQDRIADLKNERSKVADQLDDIIDEEKNGDR